jgi:cholestenol delta-isomerase
MISEDGAQSQASHPYYPIGIEISGGYSANESPVFAIILYFSLGLTAVLGAVLAIATYLRPSMSKADRLSILWFALCKYLAHFLSPQRLTC